MNYSYLMEIDNIDLLKQNNFKIKYFGNNYRVIFNDIRLNCLKNIYVKCLKMDFGMNI